MKKYTSRLAIFDKVNYNRAKETFPEQVGTMDLENTTYLLSILEVSSEVDCSVILNAINLSHSWAILGQVLPQRVMNRVLLAAFYHSKLIPKLSQMAATCDGRSWIFHSISKILKHNLDLFKQSIRENSPIWTDFLLIEFADDFYDKSLYVEVPYDQRQFAFLIESVLFCWPVDKTSEVEIERDLVTSFAKFCIEANTEVGNELLSYLAPVFPEQVYDIVNGSAERLNAQSLAFYYMRKTETKKKQLTGNLAIMAEKLMPHVPKEAKRLLKKLSPDDPERETLQIMLSHFNEETKRFIVD